MYILDYLTYLLCLAGLCEAFKGETLAIESRSFYVKLHCKESGSIMVWKEHSSTTPKQFTDTIKVWRR